MFIQSGYPPENPRRLSISPHDRFRINDSYTGQGNRTNPDISPSLLTKANSVVWPMATVAIYFPPHERSACVSEVAILAGSLTTAEVDYFVVPPRNDELGDVCRSRL